MVWSHSVIAAMVKLLRDRFGISPTRGENQTAAQTIAATSPFESQPHTRLRGRVTEEDVEELIAFVNELREEVILRLKKQHPDLLFGEK
jgi:hypothetical protein